MRCLHLGCGDNILPSPFCNVDARDLPGVDTVAPIYPLVDFENEAYDLVYVSHVLEHFSHQATLNVLKEWCRVIKPGGILRLSVPSFENIVKIYEKSGKLANVLGIVCGGQTYPHNYHYSIFDRATLTQLMEDAGLTAIHPWDCRRTEHADHWDFSQALTDGIPISLNLEGFKPCPQS